ncbi:MAG: hypothetical protein D6780_04095 [Candidatus Dadabacteria bacterium]|nr:MAG: hypothetical protein D6780_04095 [Candidatus Dadabacteria bacterium]
MGNEISKNRRYLLTWLKRTLKPLIRVLLSNYIKLNELIEVAKAAYIEVAEEELKKQGLKPSASKIYAMTGVHRKDVARFKKSGEKPQPKDNVIMKIMSQWQNNKKFTTKAGKPKALTFHGTESEFAKLVDTVNGGDLNPYAVLFEMKRIGAVKQVGNKISLVWQDFAPKPTVKEGLEMLAEDTEDLVKAVTENVFKREKTPNLHLKTEFDKIDPDKIPIIKQWLLKEGSRFHKKVSKFLSQFDADFCSHIPSHKATAKVSYTSFSTTSIQFNASEVKISQAGGG